MLQVTVTTDHTVLVMAVIDPGIIGSVPVCLFVFKQDNSKSYGRILLRFSGNTLNGTTNN